MSKSSLDMQKVVHEKNMDFRGTMYIQINVYIIYSPGFWRAEAPKERTNRFRYTYIYIYTVHLRVFRQFFQGGSATALFPPKFFVGLSERNEQLGVVPREPQGFCKKKSSQLPLQDGPFYELGLRTTIFLQGFIIQEESFLKWWQRRPGESHLQKGSMEIYGIFTLHFIQDGPLLVIDGIKNPYK